MGRISGAFARLSARERMLVTVMGGLVTGLVVFLLNMSLSSAASTLEDNIAKERTALREIYANAGDYIVAQGAFDAQQAQAEANAKLNLTASIAPLAQQVSFEAVDTRNNPTGRKRLDDFLDYGAPKTQPLGRKKKRRGDKVDPLENYYRRDLEVTVRDGTTFNAIYELMEKIERSKEMLFITELRLDRNKRNPDRAGRGKIVVSTYIYQEGGDE